MHPHQQPITPEAYECLLQAHHSLQQQNDIFYKNNQTLRQHNDSLMQHIGNLYQTITFLGTENRALRRDYEVLQTKFNDLKQNDDHGFRPEEKLEREEAMVRGKQDFENQMFRLPSYHEAIKGTEEQSHSSASQNRGDNFSKTRTFWEAKEKGSLQQDKNEKEKDFNVCDMAVKCKVEKEETMGRGKQDFEKHMLRRHSYRLAMKRTEEQSLSSTLQSRGENFLKTCTFWEAKEKGSLQQDKNEKEKDLNVCDTAVKCKVEKEETMERGKQDFEKHMLRHHSYRLAMKRTAERSLSPTLQSRGENFLKTCTFWEMKEKGSLQQDKNEKEKDLNVCDMAVKCKVEKEETMGRGKHDFEKQMLRPPAYHEAIKGTEEDFLKTHTFWEVKEKGTSYQDKDNLKKVDMSIANENLLKSHEKEESPEHINGRVPEEDMCQQELSMNLLKAEVERGLEQDKESVKEHENFTDLSDQSKKQEESEYQALLKELEDVQLKIVAQQDLNAIMKSNTKEEEDNLEQLLKEAKRELVKLAVRNRYLIKDINAEREMTGILHATIGDLEEPCGRLLLRNFLESNKHQKDERSRRERQLEQWEMNRWEDN